MHVSAHVLTHALYTSLALQRTCPGEWASFIGVQEEVCVSGSCSRCMYSQTRRSKVYTAPYVNEDRGVTGARGEVHSG